MSNFFRQLPKIKELDEISVRDAKQKLKFAYGILQSALNTYEGLSRDVQRDVRSVQYCVRACLSAIMEYLDGGYEKNASADNVPGLELSLARYKKALRSAAVRQDAYEKTSKKLGMKEQKVGYEDVPTVTFSTLRGVETPSTSNKEVFYLIGGVAAFVGGLMLLNHLTSKVKSPPSYAAYGTRRPTEK